MEYKFNDNEFTNRDLLEYMKRSYGVQVNGKPFTSLHIINWIREGKVPVSYGGHIIEDVKRYDELNGLCVLTIQGLSRKEVTEYFGDLSKFEKTKNNKRKVDVNKVKQLPRKQRTELYYQILGSKNSTIKTLKESTLPNNWKELGITSNQFQSKRRKVNKDKS